MSKERRKLEAVSKGAVNLLDSTAAVGGAIDGAAPLSAVSAALGQTEMEQTANSGQQTEMERVRCGSDEAKEAEGVVSGFVPNPTVMLVRLVTSGVVVPVIQVRAYLFRRGMKVQVYRAFDGWRLK